MAEGILWAFPCADFQENLFHGRVLCWGLREFDVVMHTHGSNSPLPNTEFKF